MKLTNRLERRLCCETAHTRKHWSMEQARTRTLSRVYILYHFTGLIIRTIKVGEMHRHLGYVVTLLHNHKWIVDADL